MKPERFPIAASFSIVTTENVPSNAVVVVYSLVISII